MLFESRMSSFITNVKLVAVNELYIHLEYDAMKSDREVPLFQKNLLPHLLGTMASHPSRMYS